jgi:hypothetical protein
MRQFRTIESTFLALAALAAFLLTPANLMADNCDSCFVQYGICWGGCSNETCQSACAMQLNDCLCNICKDQIFCGIGGGH